MTADERRARLAQTKLTLAKKYMNLARICNSKPRQRTWLRQAEKHRMQAAQVIEAKSKVN